jgi:glycosyltransferase involved in cell wall biosynthesis
MNSNEKVLSIIIIGRNEQQNIERCLKTIIKSVARIESFEIIYVDSDSTDHTIEIARKYPVRIYQLRAEWFLSAAAGRFIGTLNSCGKYLFFIDGDSIVFNDWIPKGIEFLEGHSETAAVAGKVHEVFIDKKGKVLGFLKNRYGEQECPRFEKTLGGIALYRRSVLEQVGTFNPYISVDEERELGFRIRRDCYNLIRIPEPMAITYGPQRETLDEIKRRYKTRLYTFGTTLRYCQKNGFFRQYIKERLGFVTSFIYALFTLLMLSIFLIVKGWFIPIFIIGLIGTCIIRILKPSLFKRLSISMIKRFLITIRTIQSYFNTTPQMIEDYPKRAKQIQFNDVPLGFGQS